MSSHREAPEIAKDPVADSTDVYAFVSPDKPDTVTLIANYVPLQAPDGGPNFYEFGDDVLYEIHIDNDGDGQPDVTYQFQFNSVLQNPDSFLYNTGPITVSGGTVNTSNWNRRQFYSVVRIDRQRRRGNPRRGILIGSNLACPPCNIGPLSTPGYQPSSTKPDALTKAFTYQLSSGETVFAGQRAEGFYVDLGSIFDLGDLRPFANLHNTFGLPVLTGMPGVNATKALNVHSIAVQVPMQVLQADGSRPRHRMAPGSVVGVWTTASRQRVRVLEPDSNDHTTGPWVQVSRMGNPLINEVIIPLGDKDRWNGLPPSEDHQFVKYYVDPELARLLPALYHQPSSTNTLFPNLAGLNAQIAMPGNAVTRDDLVAVLLTGIPSGVVNGFQNFTGPKPADYLRLNMAVPPASSPSNLGLLGGDAAGFPNGRRVFDDVTVIELRAIAGLTYQVVHPASFTADGAASIVTDGLTSSASDLTANGTVTYLSSFPYLGNPLSGFTTPST